MSYRSKLDEMSLVQLYTEYNVMSRVMHPMKHHMKASGFSLLSKENKKLYLANMANQSLFGITEVFVTGSNNEHDMVNGCKEDIISGIIPEYTTVLFKDRRKHKVKLEGREQPISMTKVEADAFDIFRRGDKVKSIIGNNDKGFEGIVTDFELSTNRVICLSNNNKCTQRIRYAYKPSELELVFNQEDEDVISIVPGMEALVKLHTGKTVKVKAVHYITVMDKEELIALVSIDKSNYLFYVPEDVTRERLEDIGISEIQILN